MITLKAENRLYFKSELLEGVAHGFTSKLGGVSHGKIEGLNLGFRVGDDKNDVLKNYQLVSQDLELPFENIVAAKQIHSADIRIIGDAEKGYGIAKADEVIECDGLVTSVPNVPLCVFYADCVPILLADSDAGVIAAVHSGWRGTVKQIAGSVVDVMCKEFGASPQNIKAAIGPSIGRCCFETGGEVAEQFNEDLVTTDANGKLKVDLWEANRRILQGKGLVDANIDIFGLCTICHSDKLYSYRTHGENTGRMGAFIMIREERYKQDD